MRPVFLILLIGLIASPLFTATDRYSAFAGPQETSEAELSPEQIIQKFSEKESEFFEAWKRYTYTQTAVVRVLSVDHVPTRNEVLMLVYEVVFTDEGEREFNKLEERGRLENIKFTHEDEEAILNLLPFALTAEDLPLYNIDYRGKERVDELDCYVFSVRPKNTKGTKLYFDGKIWVDDVDLQIVRTVGKVVPEVEGNQFPEFETLRQVVDGKYWFPTWTHAHDTLSFGGFGNSQDVEIEETVTYEGYREFKSKTRIRFGKVPSEAEEK